METSWSLAFEISIFAVLSFFLNKSSSEFLCITLEFPTTIFTSWFSSGRKSSYRTVGGGHGITREGRKTALSSVQV